MPLVRNQTLTEREYDTRRATERDAAAQVGSLEAAPRQAELNLDWTEVRAPIAGRISSRRVDPGNLIAGGPAGATLLTDIVSIDPIHFVFDGSEIDFLRYPRLASRRSTALVARRAKSGLGPARGRDRVTSTIGAWTSSTTW